MGEVAREAGLDMCDVRVSYRDNRTSTPSRERICSVENVCCWDNNNDEASVIQVEESRAGLDDSPGLCPGLCDSPVSITLSTDMEASRESRPDIDLSYGGAWAVETDQPELMDGLYNFGISVFDSSDEQVSNSNSIRTSQGLTRVVPSLLNRGQSSEKDQNALRLEKKGEWKRFLRNDLEENEAPKDILELKVCHKKSKADENKEIENNLDDFRQRKLRIYVNNVRGWFSKRESAEAIFIKNKTDIIMLCETLMTASRFPELAGFTTYYRNRKSRAAGGVAIMIRDEIARYAVKVDVGRLENEFLALKFTNTSPHLVLIVYYGAQSKAGVDTIKLHLSELFEVVKKHKDLGCSINLCGDFNLQIGDSILKNNHPESNPNGRLFLSQLEMMGLTILNQRSSDQVTFVDRSGKNHKRVCLDFVISNHPNSVSEFRTDNSDYEFTPYSVKMRKKVATRTYADHFALMYEFETLWQDRVKFKTNSVWNYKKKLGDVKFDIFTSNAFCYLMKKVDEEPSIDLVQKAFENTLTKGLFQSYGRRSITASKVTRINDDLVWRKRISEIEKLHEQFKEDKECNQVYKTKKQILRGQSDKQNVAVEVDNSSEVLEDLEDILNYVLSYNVTNMEKVPPSARVKEIIERKAEVIKLMLSDERVKDFPKEIPWEVYMRVLKKIMAQKKACFRNFIKTGQRYKYATFCYLNRMFRDEDFPTSSASTWLTKIWKGKGSQARLKDNRFVHGKEPFAKLMEKCLVQMISDQLDEATPQLQAGSRKGRSTRDQLLKVIILQKHHESQGKPLPVLLVDVQACFDKMRLDDVIYDTIEAGASLKVTRALRKFSDKTVIRLRGDPRENGQGEGREVRGTLGQGSNFAPPGIGLTTSKSIKQEFVDSEHLLAKVGEVVTDSLSYVDDIATLPRNEKCLRKASVKIGEALETISLRSHPDKTEVVVSGRNKKAEEMRKALVDVPARMQGNDIKVVDSALYLGMKVSQAGFRDSIDKTVNHRIAKAWGRVAEVKAVINDSRMSRLGWLRAGATLIRSVIIPSLTYPADVWVSMNKGTEKTLASAYKSMVYVIMDITTNTKWTSVLADLGLPNIMAVVDKLRINYFNHTLWGQGDVKLREILWAEHELNPKSSAVTYMDEVCTRYRIPKVSEGKLDKPLIKRQIKVADETRIWISNVKSSATQNVGTGRMRLSTNLYKLPKRSSQALLAYNAGALKLKTAWGEYHEIKDCLEPMCDGRDELGHIKICPYYATKWEDEYERDSKLLATYLVAIDKERRRKWKGECLF